MSAITDALVPGLPIHETAIRDLEGICPGSVVRDVSLASISRWRIGGIADVIVRPRNIEELARLRAWLHAQGLAHVVIGATTNLLFADEGLRAVCVQIGGAFAPLSIAGCEITAGPGVWVPGLARRAMQAGLTGIEHTCGIPGTLGGLICMNGGSQRKGIGDVVVSVTSVDLEGNIHQRSCLDCGFAYRCSVFQDNNEIIAGAVMRLDYASDHWQIRREMLEILRSRRHKFPQRQPNCGSVFVSNPKMYINYGPPGAVIERLGFKGTQAGRAMVSPIHANFIVNLGGATAADVLSLVSIIKARVLASTGYEMRAEACFVTSSGKIMTIDEAAKTEILNNT